MADPESFKAMVADLAAHGLRFSTEDSLINMPRGYSEHADHELAWAIRMKHFIVHQPMKRNEWKGDGIVQMVVDFAKSTTPVLDFGLVSVDKPKVT